MILLFIGPSGAGKDTQAELLRDRYNFNLLSAGELLRDISDDDKDGIEKMIRDAMEKGFLPDSLPMGLLEIYLDATDLYEKDLILTGSPRHFEQIKMIDDMFDTFAKEVDEVVYITLSEEEAISRLLKRWYCPTCGTTYHEDVKKPKQEGVCDADGTKLVKRDDDANIKAIKNRLKAFKESSQEIIDEYDRRGILIKIDGDKPIEDVHEEVVRRLEIDK